MDCAEDGSTGVAIPISEVMPTVVTGINVPQQPELTFAHGKLAQHAISAAVQGASQQQHIWA